MKKKSCLMLAVMLCLQIVFATVIIPVSAASYERCYDIYKSDVAITVDGNPAEWETVPWSESFVFESDGNGVFNPEIKARYKAVWRESATQGKIEIYFLIQVSGDHSLSTSDLVRVNMKSNGTSYNTDSMNRNADLSLTSKTNNTVSYDFATDVQADDTSIVEVHTTIAKPTNGSIMLDVLVQDAYYYDNLMRYSWNGGSWYSATGTGNIKETAVIPQNPLANVSVTATAGASIRLDTNDPTRSGIRFATTVSVPEGVTIQKTGTLIVPTETLESHRILDCNFNKEVLSAEGLIEGIDYYDVENKGNKWVAGQDGTWYGTLYDIKNFGREISGIGYAVVEVNGVEYTVYAIYNSDDHARSIKQVASKALTLKDANDNPLYAENSPEYNLLKPFNNARLPNGDYRIMSFNLMHHASGWGPEALITLPFTMRVENSAAQINRYQPDVVFLQERFDEWAGIGDGSVDLAEAVGNGYVWVENTVTYPIANGSTETVTNRNPILYNSNVFRLIDSGYLMLSAAVSLENNPTKNSITWAVLEDCTNGENQGQRIAVFCTHWVTTKSQELVDQTELQRTQSQETQTVVKNVLEEYGDMPVMFGGDLNMAYSFEVYQEHLAALGLSDADATVNGASNVWDIVDHIATSGVKLNAYKKVEAVDCGDHYPILCDVEMTVYRKGNTNLTQGEWGRADRFA